MSPQTSTCQAQDSAEGTIIEDDGNRKMQGPLTRNIVIPEIINAYIHILHYRQYLLKAGLIGISPTTTQMAHDLQFFPIVGMIFDAVMVDL